MLSNHRLGDRQAITSDGSRQNGSMSPPISPRSKSHELLTAYPRETLHHQQQSTSKAPLRASTRPSNKRASSYTPGLVLSPYQTHQFTGQQADRYQAAPSILRATAGSNAPGDNLYAPVHSQASSISLPLEGPDTLYRQSEATHGKAPGASNVLGHIEQSQYESTRPGQPQRTNHGATSPRAIGQPFHVPHDGYEAEKDQDTSEASQPSSYASQSAHMDPRDTGRASHSSHMYTSNAAARGGPDLSYAMQQRGLLASNAASRTQAQILKGKGRSRQTSASSAEAEYTPDRFRREVYQHPMEGDAEGEGDIPTDFASDAGKTTSEGVLETDRLRSAKDETGRKMINQYARLSEVGRGVHGRVWLCQDTINQKYYAIKSVNREDRRNKSLKRSQGEMHAKAMAFEGTETYDGRGDISSMKTANPNASFDRDMELDDPATSQEPEGSEPPPHVRRPAIMDEKVKQEIAILKRIHHPNVVQLREVIDDIRSKKIFMVLEYMPGGQVVWTHDDEPVMTVDESRRVFRDVVLGLEYLHFNGIIHRDIKPANLLLTEDLSRAKISDFGVSHVSEALARSSAGNPAGGRVGLTDDRALRKTEGSPAFFAPELCSAMESTPIGTPINELTRTGSRPDYFRAMPGKNGERPRSNGSASRMSPSTPLQPSSERFPGSHPQTPSSITTISQPLSAQQQQAHKIRYSDRPVVGKGIDVWALGVTLYCLLFGYTPFHEAKTEYELYNMIPRKEITIPAFMGADKLPTGSGVEQSQREQDPQYSEGREVVDLLSRLLEKDPTKRIELYQVKMHPWVLRNLKDSRGWLEEHDLAEAGVVQVTHEEVQQATAHRTKPQPLTSGIISRIKRLADAIASGSSVLRRSTRRERSKSISSTSASITTASAWEGRSDASRAASRQASIVKKKPSAHANVAGAHSEAPLPTTLNDLDSSNMRAHASVLTRALASAASRQSAEEDGLPVIRGASPPDDMPTKPREHYRASLLHSNRLARSLSGDSSDARPPASAADPAGHRRQSLGNLLQPPTLLQRRQSSTASDSSRPSTATALLQQAVGLNGPSTALANDRSPHNGAQEGHLASGIRKVWQKFRSGSRTPALASSSSRAVQTGRLDTGSARGASDATEHMHPYHLPSPGSTRRASVECLVFSPAASDSRPSSQDTDVDARPPFLAHETVTNVTGIKGQSLKAAGVHRGTAGLPEEALSDSSESLSDFDDEDDYGEALSPVNNGDLSQPSSYGQHGGPIMWGNAAEGWKTNPEMPYDPLGRALRHRSSDGIDARISPQSNDSELEHTPQPPHEERAASQGVIAGKSSKPLLSRDGSIQKDLSTKPPPPSPNRLTSLGHVADDENDDDDDEEEEVIIKPKHRGRRPTNASSTPSSAPNSAPPSARPSLPTSPKVSYYQPLLPP